jgi:L-fucose dehydrogenase
MQLNLTKKVIIVSGGAKGIGLGISKVLAAEGAIPFIIGRSTEDNLAAVKEIEKMGGQAKCVTAELTNPSECEKAVKQVIAEFGHIDGLINNAGVNDGVGLEKGNYESFVASFAGVFVINSDAVSAC